MLWTGPTTSDSSALQYFIPNHLKNDFGKITDILCNFYTESRFVKMQKISEKRSRKVLTILENTHHAHNISAVLRTVDVFGFMECVFLYTNKEIRFRVSDAIDRKASQWLLPRRHTNISECAQLLKNNGYKIALVTLPDFSRTSDHYQKNVPAFASNQFHSTEFRNYLGDEKIALVFGSELIGISEEWSKWVDFYAYVEMQGFSESLNVSVCAGIILQSLRAFFEQQKCDFLLNTEEQKLILEHWVAKSYPKAYEYILHRKPELLPWFEFVRNAHFYKSFQ